jgi:RNA polymerase-binding protein DksA
MAKKNTSKSRPKPAAKKTSSKATKPVKRANLKKTKSTAVVRKKTSVPAPKRKVVAPKQSHPNKSVASKAVKKKEEPQDETASVKRVFSEAQMRPFKENLEKLRDRVVDEISFLAGDNLNRSQRDSSGDLSSYSFHMADQGTDNFDREFALNLVSSEQDTLYEIDDALRRIEQGTYGVCESCGKAIEKARLMAMPSARMCVKCKSEAERGKSRFRPFGPTISQSSDS